MVLAGKVMEVVGLAARDTDLPELVGVEGEDSLGDDAGLAATEGKEAGIDGSGSLKGELLVEDATEDGVEGPVEALEDRGVVGIDHTGEVGVHPPKAVEGGVISPSAESGRGATFDGGATVGHLFGGGREGFLLRVALL